jgi:hypothetical protein
MRLSEPTLAIELDDQEPRNAFSCRLIDSRSLVVLLQWSD